MSNYNRFTIERKLKEFIEEDCNFTDVSSSVIPEKAESIAKIIAKSEGYISGLEELKMLFGLLHVSLALNKVDGQQFKEGDVIAELQGKTRDILLGEKENKYVLECHESGPEIVLYLTAGTASLILIKAIIDLIIVIIKSRQKEQKRSSFKIIKRFEKKGEINEENIIEIDIPLSNDIIKN